MAFKPGSYSPEIILSDRIISYIPRADNIKSDALWYPVISGLTSWNRDVLIKYYQIALLNLIKEGYLLEHKDEETHTSYSTLYGLTQLGRELQDNGGYIKALKEKEAKESFDKQVFKADGIKKIHDNRVKYILLFIAVLGSIVGFLGLLGKYATESRRPQTLSQGDSISKPAQSIGLVTTSSKRHHPRTVSSKPPGETGSQPMSEKIDKKPDITSPVSPPKHIEPMQVANSDNIEFKLMKAVGSSKAQSVTITMILTTSAANWYIMSYVKSIIDPDGNEYKVKSFTIGASNYFPRVVLTTGVPMKCTYTFGGVLPDVKVIKLFTYSYMHSGGEPFSVEFRDIPIDWR
jgi:hypothetical protein